MNPAVLNSAVFRMQMSVPQQMGFGVTGGQIAAGAFGGPGASAGVSSLRQLGMFHSDGVMDAYKVRWGVAWYDGLGTRLVMNPTGETRLQLARRVLTGGWGWNSPSDDPSVALSFMVYDWLRSMGFSP